MALLLIAFAVTLSLLVHEFGHVLAARLNGHRSQVLLVAMGGLTMPSGESRGWRGVFLSLAGPGAGLLLFAILSFLVPPPDPEDRTLWPKLLDLLLQINLVWSLFNLLPIWPLDGGQALQNLLTTFRRAHEAERISALVSLVVAVAIGFFLLQAHQTFAVIMVAMLAFDNWERLQRTR